MHRRPDRRPRKPMPPGTARGGTDAPTRERRVRVVEVRVVPNQPTALVTSAAAANGSVRGPDSPRWVSAIRKRCLEEWELCCGPWFTRLVRHRSHRGWERLCGPWFARGAGRLLSWPISPGIRDNIVSGAIVLLGIAAYIFVERYRESDELTKDARDRLLQSRVDAATKAQQAFADGIPKNVAYLRAIKAKGLWLNDLRNRFKSPIDRQTQVYNDGRPTADVARSQEDQIMEWARFCPHYGGLCAGLIAEFRGSVDANVYPALAEKADEVVRAAESIHVLLDEVNGLGATYGTAEDIEKAVCEALKKTAGIMPKVEYDKLEGDLVRLKTALASKSTVPSSPVPTAQPDAPGASPEHTHATSALRLALNVVNVLHVAAVERATALVHHRAGVRTVALTAQPATQPTTQPVLP